MDAEARTTAYYDRTAPAYDGQLEARPSNRVVREQFLDRVASETPRGATILDFGAGTGIDAAWYAARGYRVIAYEPSAGMMERLAARCAPAIAAGTVRAVHGDWAALAAALNAVGPVHTVAANFAVLNHVAELGDVLRRFASHLTRDGVILASLLNPFHLRDMTRRWWWAGVLRAPARGAIAVRGDVSTHRFLPRTLRRAAAPAFTLDELRSLGGGWPGVVRAHFWLAVWRKR